MVQKARFERLHITAEAEGPGPLTLAVNVDVGIERSADVFNMQRIADQAVNQVFKSAGNYMRENTCRSQK